MSNDAIVNPVKPTPAPENQSTVAPSDVTNPGPIVQKEPSLEQRNPYRNLESHRDSIALRSWQSYQEKLRPKVWPNGVSE
jgi:hypothetical protein